MPDINKQLIDLLREPRPEALWQLQTVLLASKVAPDHVVWGLLDDAHLFLTELTAKVTAREYSHFASQLDIGAVGGVVLQDLIGTEDRGAALWRRILLGGVSEGLMVMAARQYVKAWEGEMGSVYEQAAWRLYQHWWRLSERWQADLDPDQRHKLLMGLLSPLQLASTNDTAKAILATRLYQLLIWFHLQTI